MLKVPFIQQFDPNACGAGVLDMIYNYYEIEGFDQREMYEKYKQLDPHGSENEDYCISVFDLMDDARSKELDAGWAGANYESVENCVSLIKVFIDNKIPLIVIQQFSKEDPLLGHFRIIVGIDEEFIYFHDPHVEIGGANKRLSYEEFVELWQPTGENVTGGIFMWVRPKS